MNIYINTGAQRLYIVCRFGALSAPPANVALPAAVSRHRHAEGGHLLLPLSP